MQEDELISIIQNPLGARPRVSENCAGKDRDGGMTDDSLRELMERLHDDNVCYTGGFSSFRAE